MGVGVILTTLEEVGSCALAVRARITRGPIHGGYKELVRPEEIRTGARVRVVDCGRTPRQSGLVGIVERVYRYRSLERKAVHVRLEDGRWQLLWPEELEPLGEDS